MTVEDAVVLITTWLCDVIATVGVVIVEADVLAKFVSCVNGSYVRADAATTTAGGTFLCAEPDPVEPMSP